MPRIKLTQEHVDAQTTIYDHGWYTLACKELLEKKDKEGADLYLYSFEIIGADDSDNARFVGKKAFINVSEKGFGFAIPLFRAAGANIPDKIGPEGLDVEMSFLVGKKIRVQNNPAKDRNGILRNNWNTYDKLTS